MDKHEQGPEETRQNTRYARIQALSAVAGLVIGVAALIHSLIAYQTSASLEEVKLAPYLSGEFDIEKKSLAFVNNGSGAARVVAVNAAIDTEQYFFDERVKDPHANKKAELVMDFIADFVLRKSLLDEVFKGSPKRYLAVERMILPGEVISPGDQSTVYGVQMSANFDEATDFAAAQKWIDGFGKVPDRFDLRVCYCSVTGKSCRVSSLRDPVTEVIEECPPAIARENSRSAKWRPRVSNPR